MGGAEPVNGEQREMSALNTIAGAQGGRGRPRQRRLRRLAVITGAVLAAWLAVTVGVRLAYADKILPGTTMAGLSLGGRSPERARELLAAALAREQSVRLTADGRRFVVRASEVGYRIDVPASAERARSAGRDGPLAGLWSTLASLSAPRKLEPVVHVNHRRIAERIAEIARAVDRPATTGALIADPNAVGMVRALAPRAGRTLDRADTVAAVVAALHDRRPGPVALSVQTQATVTQDEAQDVADRARAYLRTPVRLTGGQRTRTLTARQTATILALEQTPKASATAVRLGVDQGRVKQLVSTLARDLDRPPRDARIKAPAQPTSILDGQGDLRWRARRARVRVIPGSSGRGLQRAAAAAALANAVRGGRHTVALALKPVPPRITTRDARAVTSLLGTFTTRYACCQPRVRNIRLIAKAVDGSVVAPGERFSLNEATGERTGTDGYVRAPFIAYGKIVPSVGGGVSQFSTTMYNAAYFAGLRIDTHRPHSFYIDRYPVGREATLNFPDIDLTWTNDTPSPVLIRTATDATSVVVSLYGADTGRRVRAETGERTSLTTGGFAITVRRVLRYRGGRVVRQPYTTRYERPPPPE